MNKFWSHPPSRSWCSLLLVLCLRSLQAPAEVGSQQLISRPAAPSRPPSLSCSRRAPAASVGLKLLKSMNGCSTAVLPCHYTTNL